MVFLILHGGLANTAQLYFIILALWGFARFFMKKGVDPSYRGALMIGEGLLVLQALTGAILWLMGASPARGIHFLYGLLTPAVIPLTISYTKGRQERAEMLVYAAAVLVAAALIMRAVYTGEIVL